MTRTRIVRTFFVSLFALAVPVSLVSCNTVEGVGEDVEAAGDAVDDAASD
jgi:predicted small secreted protein